MRWTRWPRTPPTRPSRFSSAEGRVTPAVARRRQSPSTARPSRSGCPTTSVRSARSSSRRRSEPRPPGGVAGAAARRVRRKPDHSVRRRGGRLHVADPRDRSAAPTEGLVAGAARARADPPPRTSARCAPTPTSWSHRNPSSGLYRRGMTSEAAGDSDRMRRFRAIATRALGPVSILAPLALVLSAGLIPPAREETGWATMLGVTAVIAVVLLFVLLAAGAGSSRVQWLRTGTHGLTARESGVLALHVFLLAVVVHGPALLAGGPGPDDTHRVARLHQRDVRHRRDTRHPDPLGDAASAGHRVSFSSVLRLRVVSHGLCFDAPCALPIALSRVSPFGTRPVDDARRRPAACSTSGRASRRAARRAPRASG